MPANHAQISEKEADYCLLSTLDDIAWLYNLRGKDVECNPVFIAYSLIASNIAYLFVDEQKFNGDLKAALKADGVMLKPYAAVASVLESIDQTLMVDKADISQGLLRSIPANVVKFVSNPVRAFKAVKNEVEINNIREAMRRDGVALLRLFRWLDAELEQRGVTEVEVAERLIELRAAQGDYHGESFSAIVGYKGNGAIVHYRPLPGKCATIEKEGILLLDSGGQYTCGTTDITRTIALSLPTAEQKRHFTLVLKGNIALDQAVFPVGTRGIQLDILARQFLWAEQLNYGHGTGHGVGFFLNVHEPPQGFMPGLAQRGTTPFEAGMFTSNEPGFYLDGAYGIRIENLVLARSAGKTEFGEFLELETMTMFPIDQQLIDKTLLTPKEIEWLNDYHAKVYEVLAPTLTEEEQAWLKAQCAAI